ncbi:MAG: hypothetical protein [Bacteriophage sp.]|nr:MAG: hypothetical protein [Bacteriophage sp.]
MSQHTNHVPATAKEAKELGLKYYFTGKPCKHGHVAARDTTHSNRCFVCIKLANRKAQAKYAKKPKVKVKQAKHMKAWRDKNLEECRLKDRVKYYQKQLNKALDELSVFQASKS